MVEIISRGMLPVEDIFKGTCGNCKTVFKFKRDEADQVLFIERGGPCLSISCPLDECNETVNVSMHSKIT